MNENVENSLNISDEEFNSKLYSVVRYTLNIVNTSDIPGLNHLALFVYTDKENPEIIYLDKTFDIEKLSFNVHLIAGKYAFNNIKIGAVFSLMPVLSKTDKFDNENVTPEGANKSILIIGATPDKRINSALGNLDKDNKLSLTSFIISELSPEPKLELPDIDIMVKQFYFSYYSAYEMIHNQE